MILQVSQNGRPHLGLHVVKLLETCMHTREQLTVVDECLKLRDGAGGGDGAQRLPILIQFAFLVRQRRYAVQLRRHDVCPVPARTGLSS